MPEKSLIQLILDLLRDPELVAADVADGYVTVATAASTYGVVLTDGRVDGGETIRARAELRRARLGGEPTAGVDAAATAGASAPRRDGEGWFCPASGARLGNGDDWRPEARVVTHVAAERLAEHGVRVRPRTQGPRVLMDEYYSPACGTLLDVRIRVDAEPATAQS